MVAVQDGVVGAAGEDTSWPGRGLYVTVAGADGITSYQMHLSRVDVVAGQSVKAGEPVGLSGNSGWSTGSHLHLGCRDEAETMNGHQGFVDPTALLV